MAFKTINSTSTNNPTPTHLRLVDNTSNTEAPAVFKCRTLPRRIRDLKECGFSIVSQVKQDSTG